jgi:hypothetical protein
VDFEAVGLGQRKTPRAEPGSDAGVGERTKEIGQPPRVVAAKGSACCGLGRRQQIDGLLVLALTRQQVAQVAKSL